MVLLESSFIHHAYCVQLSMKDFSQILLNIHLFYINTTFYVHNWQCSQCWSTQLLEEKYSHTTMCYVQLNKQTIVNQYSDFTVGKNMLYSGKFSLGANFHNFLGLISNCENMNHGKKKTGWPAGQEFWQHHCDACV